MQPTQAPSLASISSGHHQFGTPMQHILSCGDGLRAFKYARRETDPSAGGVSAPASASTTSAAGASGTADVEGRALPILRRWRLCHHRNWCIVGVASAAPQSSPQPGPAVMRALSVDGRSGLQRISMNGFHWRGHVP